MFGARTIEPADVTSVRIKLASGRELTGFDFEVLRLRPEVLDVAVDMHERLRLKRASAAGHGRASELLGRLELARFEARALMLRL